MQRVTETRVKARFAIRNKKTDTYIRKSMSKKRFFNSRELAELYMRECGINPKYFEVVVVNGII